MFLHSVLLWFYPRIGVEEKPLSLTRLAAFLMPGGVVMSVAPTEAPAYQLNTSHRCDRCGSQAYVRVMLRMSLHLPDGGVLLWCNHHWQEYKYGLSGLIEHVTDETSRLAEHIQPPEATELNSIKK